MTAEQLILAIFANNCLKSTLFTPFLTFIYARLKDQAEATDQTALWVSVILLFVAYKMVYMKYRT